jgi:transcriptional regulator with XRE-family HTH domain
VLLVADSDTELGSRLQKAREQVGFTQGDVALLVGQPRPVVSNWETGLRRPNSQQLTKLSSIFRVPLEDLLGISEHPRPEFEQLVFRDAGDRLDTDGKYEIQRFLAFLDDYGEFLEVLGEPAGLTEPPLTLREGRFSKDDVRRKAEEARRYFRLGDGPVGDLAGLADVFGITVYLAPLGSDLKGTISGASLLYPKVGFSILVNGQTTPGRRQFTLAHELGHALFHSGSVSVGYPGHRGTDERFADSFASEFLVPTASLQATVESMGLVAIKDPESVVHLQRYFNVSYEMMLVRLRSIGMLTEDDLQACRSVRPVHLAERLGYATDLEEWNQDPDRWGLVRFPRRFLRLLRRAFSEGKVTISGAAAMTGLAEEDIDDLVRDKPVNPGQDEEYEYLRVSS